MTSSNRLALSQPVESPAVPVVEMVTPTQRDEARSAMALIAELRNQTIPVRDIALVVRDLDQYEEPLFRAALQHQLVPDMWTQLRVTQTQPFALIKSVCDALDSNTVDKQTLLLPLEHQWTPPAASDSHWPIEQKAVQHTKAALSEDSLTRTEWANRVQQADHIDSRVSTYLQWLDGVPAPQPETAAAVLGDVVDAYAAHGLPETKAIDSPALLETERDASAVQRVTTLVDHLEDKLDDWLDQHSVEHSWATVAELATSMATQRPGSREHSHAKAVDIFEANDLWGLNIPYVIAVGLTASEWPQTPNTTLPAEFTECILRGSGDVSKLAPDTSWTTSHDRDHFADTLRAASRGVIVTRHRETTDGETVHPSPFLSSLNTKQVTNTELQQLRSSDPELPESIQNMLHTDPEPETHD